MRAMSTPLAAATPPHHRDGGFQNNYTPFTPKTVAELLRWRVDAWRAGKPAAPTQPIATMAPDLAFIHAPTQPAVTWIGHATALLQAGGLNLLTDPVFSDRCSPLSFMGPKRWQPPGLAMADLPRIDAVLVSHNHYDHLDEASVKALAAAHRPLFVVALGLKVWFEQRGITNVVELDWWQHVTLNGSDIVFTPAQHWSGRGLDDRMQTLWGGFAVFAPDAHLFFAGDTGYSRDFVDIRERFAHRQRDGGFDLALIPVGAYEPRWFMQQQHVNPDEAVRIHRDLAAKRSLGIHWGVFQLTDEALDEPPRALAAARAAQGLSEEDFFVLAVGQTRALPERGQSTPAP